MLSAKNYYLKLWYMIIVLSTVLSAVYIPLRIVLDFRDNSLLIYFDWLITIIFAADLLMNIKIKNSIKEEFYFEDGLYSKRYFFQWFIIDLIAAIPLGLILSSPYFHIFRLVKLARIANYMHNWRQRAVRLGDYLNLAFFIFWLLIFSHWLACGWITLSYTNNIFNGWNIYIVSFYWVIQTLTTVGFGDVPSASNAQMIYAMIVMLFGVGVYGYVIGNVANILSKKNPGRTQFFENMDKLKSFVSYRNIPPELQKRILNYYVYIWKKRLGFDETSFLEGLPSGLRTEVEVFLKRDILQKIPLFKGVEDNFLKEVSLHLRPVVYTPGDFIFKEGDLGNEMHFVIRGRLEVLSGDGMIVYSELSDGDFFGEIALFKNRPRTASIRAITFSDLYVLDKEAFEVVLKNYPDIASHIKTIAEQREDRSSKPEVGD